MFRVLRCSEFGVVQSTASFGVRRCSDFGVVQSSALFKVRRCSELCVVQRLALFRARRCSEFGIIQSTALFRALIGFVFTVLIEETHNMTRPFFLFSQHIKHTRMLRCADKPWRWLLLARGMVLVVPTLQRSQGLTLLRVWRRSEFGVVWM